MTPEFMNLEKTNIVKLRKTLKNHTAYLAKVAFNANNTIHEAIIFIGFADTGGYCEVYNNTYDSAEDMNKMYYVEIIKPLHTFN